VHAAVKNVEKQEAVDAFVVQKEDGAACGRRVRGRRRRERVVVSIVFGGFGVEWFGMKELYGFCDFGSALCFCRR